MMVRGCLRVCSANVGRVRKPSRILSDMAAPLLDTAVLLGPHLPALQERNLLWLDLSTGHGALCQRGATFWLAPETLSRWLPPSFSALGSRLRAPSLYAVDRHIDARSVPSFGAVCVQAGHRSQAVRSRHLRERWHKSAADRG